MKLTTTFTSAAALLLAMASPAQAAFADFTAAPDAAVPGGLLYTVGGTTMTATATVRDQNGVEMPGMDALAVHTIGGLGVATYGGDSTDIEGYDDLNGDPSTNFAEGLILSFNELVQLNEITFNNVDLDRDDADTQDDDVAIYVDGNFLGRFGLKGPDGPDGGMLTLVLGPLTGQVFEIVAGVRGPNTDLAGAINDDFLLSSIDVTETPLPAAALLFATGLAAVARRKKQA